MPLISQCLHSYLNISLKYKRYLSYKRVLYHYLWINAKYVKLDKCINMCVYILNCMCCHLNLDLLNIDPLYKLVLCLFLCAGSGSASPVHTRKSDSQVH